MPVEMAWWPNPGEMKIVRPKPVSVLTAAVVTAVLLLVPGRADATPDGNSWLVKAVTEAVGASTSGP